MSGPMGINVTIPSSSHVQSERSDEGGLSMSKVAWSFRRADCRVDAEHDLNTDLVTISTMNHGREERDTAPCYGAPAGPIARARADALIQRIRKTPTPPTFGCGIPEPVARFIRLTRDARLHARAGDHSPLRGTGLSSRSHGRHSISAGRAYGLER
jgi:hypothetical protein